jgi:hypothetical protein
MDKKLLKDAERQERKFRTLEREFRNTSGITKNPNTIVTKLTGELLTPEEERVLNYGLNHGLATRLTESDVVASAESIWDQLNRENVLNTRWLSEKRKIKNSIKALACNFLDFDDRGISEDSKHIKILKSLREKYAILKPDKGNGIVLIKKTDYENCLTGLFAYTTKFRKINIDPTFTQLATVQRYLRTIYNRNEIDDFTYEEIRPQSTRPARAYGLPKMHKSFDVTATFPTYHRHDWNCVPTRCKIPITTSLSSGTK